MGIGVKKLNLPDQRNPFMAVFATNALRYKGLGSGIVRVLEENSKILIENEYENNLNKKDMTKISNFNVLGTLGTNKPKSEALRLLLMLVAVVAMSGNVLGNVG